MKLNKTLALIAIAVATLCTSPSMQAQDAPKPAGDQAAPAARPPRGPGITVEALSKSLDLTEDQKTKLKPIVDEYNKNLADLRKELQGASPEDRRAKMKALRDGLTPKLKEVLTPEQFAKWEKMAQFRGRPPGAPTAPPAPAAPDAPKN